MLSCYSPDENLRATAGHALNARVLSRTDLDGRVSIIGLAREDGDTNAFEPGQHVVVRLADGSQGHYSIASAPGGRFIEILVALVEDKNSAQDWRLVIGDRVFLSAPRGHFSLGQLPADAPLIFVCTGTGIAPFVSMLRSFPERAATSVLVHGARTEPGLAFRKELEAMSELAYVPVLSQPPFDWDGASGYVQSLIEPNAFERQSRRSLDRRAHVFLCGHPPMIADLKARFRMLGFAATSLHSEGY